MTDRMAQLETVQTEAKELFRKKNTDYGDAFATYGTVGVLVRIGDKIQRLQSITSKGVTLIDDEQLRDTLIDLHNYAAMCVMLLDENTTTELVISDNEPIVKKWTITGDNGIDYERESYVDESGVTVHTCSCPSFVYCQDNVKTCKHIKGNYD